MATLSQFRGEDYFLKHKYAALRLLQKYTKIKGHIIKTIYDNFKCQL